jgi:hypothetical protein
MENIRERQENEISVLKSIFWNHFTDLREEQQIQNAKKTTTDLNTPIFRITLFPQNSQSQDDRQLYVQIDLKVKLTPNYPNE